ncbi:hypothetical protein L210DRAFT_3112563 [Boletus edulis BED1]|uniref:Uncharacterized protein n=1 Tax=Boletus edulis BED1 TaxID=1328754 RepID=A0AAD4GGX7_BOLED|nr:hypothetical protein L210DRAFT_3112563 [Boletus edulis BED1]
MSAGIQLQKVLHSSTRLALTPPPSTPRSVHGRLITLFGSAAVPQPKGRISYTLLPVSFVSTHGCSPLISLENGDARIVNPSTAHFVLHGTDAFRNVGSPRTAFVQCNQVYVSNPEPIQTMREERMEMLIVGWMYAPSMCSSDDTKQASSPTNCTCLTSRSSLNPLTTCASDGRLYPFY